MDVLEILFLIAGVLLIAVLFLVFRGDRSHNEVNRQLSQMGDMAERLSASHLELSGRLQQSQQDMNERLEALSKRMGDGLTQQTEKTGQTLKELHERLAVIDAAQQKITVLSQQVVGLQDILSNKQARGAFGELQLNDLVSSILSPSAYKFQVQMSNGTRADCLLTLPNPPGSIVIDVQISLRAITPFGMPRTMRPAKKHSGALGRL